METHPTLGVDACKAHLDACLLRPCGRLEERRFANDARGVALLAWGEAAPGLGMESTGGYERGLALAGLEAGRLVRVATPRRVRDFARATGRLNKTDRADARATAGFLSKVEGRPWCLSDPASRELEGLTAHRAALLKERTRLSNRLERRASLPALVVRHLETRPCALDDEVRKVEAEGGRLARSDEGFHEASLAELGRSGGLDWSRAALDSTSVRAKRGAARSAPRPPTEAEAQPDRQPPGRSARLPVSAGNRDDSLFLAPLLDAVLPVQGPRGRPRRRPAKLHADKGYDRAFCREERRARGVVDRVARRGRDSSKRLGRHRWVVERSFAWRRAMRRLAARWERKAAPWLAFALLGCAVLCLRRLARHLGL